MYNYFIAQKKEAEKKKETALKSINYLKTNTDNQKHFENRIKHFTHDYTQMLTKVRENIDNNKKLLQIQLKQQKLTNEEAEIRVNNGIFNKENVKKMKDSMLKNELNRYIASQNKKTYFKSIEYIELSPLFSDQRDTYEKTITDKIAKEDKNFISFASVNPHPIKINFENFKNPKLITNEIDLVRKDNATILSTNTGNRKKNANQKLVQFKSGKSLALSKS